MAFTAVPQARLPCQPHGVPGAGHGTPGVGLRSGERATPLGLPVGWGPSDPQEPRRWHSWWPPVLFVCSPVFAKLPAFSLRHICCKTGLLLSLLLTESPHRSSGRRNKTSGVVAASPGLPGGHGPSPTGQWGQQGQGRERRAPNGGFPSRERTEEGGSRPGWRVLLAAWGLRPPPWSSGHPAPSMQKGTPRLSPSLLGRGGGGGQCCSLGLVRHGRCLKRTAPP